MVRRKIKLEIIDRPRPNASVIAPTIRPTIQGDDDEDLLCGGCGVVLLEGFSRDVIAFQFAGIAQMLFTCPECDVHNQLLADAGP